MKAHRFSEYTCLRCNKPGLSSINSLIINIIKNCQFYVFYRSFYEYLCLRHFNKLKRGHSCRKLMKKVHWIAHARDYSKPIPFRTFRVNLTLDWSLWCIFTWLQQAQILNAIEDKNSTFSNSFQQWYWFFSEFSDQLFNSWWNKSDQSVIMICAMDK